MFSLKYASLLQFDQHYHEKTVHENLHSVYGINRVPSDTYMRERLDVLEPGRLRKLFTRLFSCCQRSGYLKNFIYFEDRYLLPLDGTGFFHSKTVHCENCCVKNHRDGTKSYYHQMLAGSLVHPDLRVVLPFAPEPAVKSDGSAKNDCERRAAERFLEALNREHPTLKLIITGDSLFSNGPYIKHLREYGHRFILVANEKDHKYLFKEFNTLPTLSHKVVQSKVTHRSINCH